jgi:DOPA 4,5-dioxygenase
MTIKKEMSIDEIDSYHAHVYYEMHNGFETAKELAQLISNRFQNILVSNLIERPVGPHPVPMFEADFSIETFHTFVPWLMLNRQNLNILIHPNTKDMYADHLIYPIWLGNKLELNEEFLRISSNVLKNTTPQERLELI